MNKELKIQDKLNNISKLIGNTPLIEISFMHKGNLKKVYAKLEYYNLTGSIKDRMAFHIIKKAYLEGRLKEEDTIVEATSGNTGIAISAMGRVVGNKVCIYMPDWMSDERKNIIRSLGADIRLVSKEEGGFIGSIQMTKDLAKTQKNIFLTSQFSNTDNSEANYLTTGPEIYNALNKHGLTPDALVAGVGTGGTLMGIGTYLKEQNNKIHLHPLEPSNSPTLSTGNKVGNHRIQGISDEFIPDLIKLDSLDEVISVDDGDSIIMAQKLAKELGLAVGISSGANFLGAVLALDKLENKDGVVVTIFSDDNKKYLSTDLMKEEPVKPGFLSNDIELLSSKVL
ncbi:cysteine synthase A [Clostridium collagenovorans DSM 3089]|uniref:cysteine synthase n=1 Tax=Clostridium collagenovorans DSM 3089 TaxID=1121306 RepID=A0A1M5XHB1_9CLOT|nr:cysteine synthase family protein [Clostridium collagenovorans]SHH99139.1 cysteine synthase A [Clostridium collagenovorans DSM 3089]